MLLLLQTDDAENMLRWGTGKEWSKLKQEKPGYPEF